MNTSNPVKLGFDQQKIEIDQNCSGYVNKSLQNTLSLLPRVPKHYLKC